MGYISTNATSVYIGADHTGLYPNGGPGRPSVRLTSNNNYTHGLFIIDLSHMPFGCGTWPAFWTFGPSWPNNGEIGTLSDPLKYGAWLILKIDIIEGVNLNTLNAMTLHTTPNCTIAGTGMLGTLQGNDCGYYPGDDYGCGITANTALSYGAGFNSNGGGKLPAPYNLTRVDNPLRRLRNGMDLNIYTSLVFSSRFDSS